MLEVTESDEGVKSYNFVDPDSNPGELYDALVATIDGPDVGDDSLPENVSPGILAKRLFMEAWAHLNMHRQPSQWWAKYDTDVDLNGFSWAMALHAFMKSLRVRGNNANARANSLRVHLENAQRVLEELEQLHKCPSCEYVQGYSHQPDCTFKFAIDSGRREITRDDTYDEWADEAPMYPGNSVFVP